MKNYWKVGRGLRVLSPKKTESGLQDRCFEFHLSKRRFSGLVCKWRITINKVIFYITKRQTRVNGRRRRQKPIKMSILWLAFHIVIYKLHLIEWWYKVSFIQKQINSKVISFLLLPLLIGNQYKVERKCLIIIASLQFYIKKINLRKEYVRFNCLFS
jgi:hypothetical protein